MSFFIPGTKVPVYLGGVIGSNSLTYSQDMQPYYAGNRDIVTGFSDVGGVEKLVYTSAFGGYIGNLFYAETGVDIQSVRIRVVLDGVTAVDATGNAVGVNNRGGVLLGGVENNPGIGLYSLGVPFNVMQIYITTQFIDLQARQTIFGNVFFAR